MNDVLLNFCGLSGAKVYIHIVDLFKTFQTITSIYYLLANIGFDPAENEPFKDTFEFPITCHFVDM